MTDLERKNEFARLQLQQQAFISECESKINQWKKFQQDYINLKERLNTMPNELKYDIMVPFGRLAFMPGKLVKTNEVLVLLGDNWFVERSAKQSCDIIDRRLKGIEQHLEKLQKEIKMFNEQLNWTSDVLQEHKDYVNIEEKLDENESDSSKVKQKSQMTEEEKKQQRALLQKRAQEAQRKINERIQNAKLTRTNVKVEEEEGEEEEDEEDEEEKNEIEENKNQSEETQPKKKAVHWSDTNLNEKMSKIEINNDSYDDSSEDSVYDINEEKANVIHIKHTPVFKSSDETKTEIADDSETIVKTPADIYRLFYKPKSILKTQSSYESIEKDVYNEAERLKGAIQGVTKEADRPTFEPQKAFTGEIVEHTETVKKVSENLPQPTKKVSKFKASKQQ